MGNNSTLCGYEAVQRQKSKQNELPLSFSLQSQKKPSKQIILSNSLQKVSQKATFIYISPLNHHNEQEVLPQNIDLETIDQEEEIKQKNTNAKIKAQTSLENFKIQYIENQATEELSLKHIIQRQQQRIVKNQRIAVNWSLFIKIKNKNYLEDYIFLKEIGRGAYGSVLKIKMKYGGFCRAAKVVKSAAITKQKKNISKLFAEIAIPIKLDHPNLIKLFQIFEWKQQYVLIMQLCEGGDLFFNIKRSRFFAQSNAKKIIKQILEAINYMHKQGVCHRDLKPQNILIDDKNTIKIIDFGTATYYNKKTKLKDLVGTPYYIAPQVIQQKYDEKCDIWSCGVILYILLSGCPPFNGRNEKEIMEKIRTQPLDFANPIWAKKDKYAKELVMRMLNKNPDQRITAQEALNHQWIQSQSNDMNKSSSNNEVEKQVIKNLQNFHFKNKLKAVVYTYIASQLYSNEDKSHLLKIFKSIDTDGDGVIQRDELIKTFNQHSTSALTQMEVQQILKIVDTNGSGMIDFTQFVVAASNEEKMLEQKRLQSAFNYLDSDHSGYITIDEVKTFLDGSEQTADEIKKIFDEVDENGDGQISREQFIHLLIKK